MRKILIIFGVILIVAALLVLNTVLKDMNKPEEVVVEEPEVVEEVPEVVVEEPEEKPEEKEIEFTDDYVEELCREHCDIYASRTNFPDDNFYQCICEGEVQYYDYSGDEIGPNEAYTRNRIFYDSSFRGG